MLSARMRISAARWSQCSGSLMKWLDIVQRKLAHRRVHSNRTAAAANRSSDNEAAAAAASISRSDLGNACNMWRKRPSPIEGDAFRAAAAAIMVVSRVYEGVPPGAR